MVKFLFAYIAKNEELYSTKLNKCSTKSIEENEKNIQNKSDEVCS